MGCTGTTEVVITSQYTRSHLKIFVICYTCQKHFGSSTIGRMQNKLLPIIGIAVIAAVVIGLKMTQPTKPTESMMKAAAPAPVAEVKSGKTVQLETEYQSPAGPEKVAFSLEVDAAGTIVAANTTVLGKAPTSIMRQEKFKAELPAAVVGKKLADLTQLDRVGGSSLTTGAFNAALDKLKAQAGS